MLEYGINAFCKESAQIYLDYLETNGKGIDVVNTVKIDMQLRGNYRLKLSKKLFDSDNIFFKIANVTYTNEEIAVVEYDRDNNLLLLHPNHGFENLLNAVAPQDILVISDLKHLIRRVYTWYDYFGCNIQLPTDMPKILPELHHRAATEISPEQFEAFNNIFSYPFSYVWGAPGTGKTKFVLSNAVANYKRNGLKVAILAPTNNALEQSMYGVISVLEEQELSTHDIIRLGVPSKHFAEMHPQCCEIKGIQTKLDELEKQKEIYIKKRKICKFYNALIVLQNEILPLMESASNNIVSYEELKKQRLQIEVDIAAQEILWNSAREKISETVKQIENKKRLTQGFLFSIKKAFNSSKAINIESEIESLKILLKTFDDDQEKATSKRDKLIGEKAELTEEIMLKEQNMQSLFGKIQCKAAISGRLLKRVSVLSESNFVSAYNDLLALEQQGIEKLESENALSQDDNAESIDKRIELIDLEIKNLSVNSTGEKIKNALVVAMTVDRFIAQYGLWNNPLEGVHFEHIFLDEAGYCSLIKGAILLTCCCPITFFGDHMQLPPVCEMNDDQFDTLQYRPVYLWAQPAIAIESMLTRGLKKCYDEYKSNLSPMFENLHKSNLTETFRFGNRLSNILDKYVYLNGFHSADENADFEIVVVHCDKTAGIRKRENPEEARQIANWIDNYSPEDFVVLSPYTNQVKLIGEYAKSAREAQRIMTVHASQGREWHTVILSVSDTSDMWFTDSQNTMSKGMMLINTAVSRAKSRLVVMCDTNFWKDTKSQLIGAIINEKNCLIS